VVQKLGAGHNVLEKVLASNPKECKKLIGTGIIEEDYFDKLS
jgi:hypothetical protein